ncbi:SCO5717 family growth-regulating ATPase [Streptomyces sp. NPDC046931]|uniref:SCO5717 family growth-regulating ATPase n=1 Tax=Streptomyces sp. NPDC046931 TaxID=3154806 RepID=UPI0034079AD9
MDRADVGALVQSAVDGDTAAWKTLVEGLSPLVWSVVRAHRLPDADAHEVYQTVWFRFAQHLGRIPEPEKAGVWLASTTRHECLKLLKNLRRLSPTDDPQLPDSGSVDRTAEQSFLDSEEAAAEAERSRLMWQEFEELGERCKQLLRVLMASPPPSYAEVSAALGIPVGSIGPMRQRCLRHLRARIQARAGSRRDSAEDAAAPEQSTPHCNFSSPSPAAGPQKVFIASHGSHSVPLHGTRVATLPAPFELQQLNADLAEVREAEATDESDAPASPDDESHASTGRSRSDRDGVRGGWTTSDDEARDVENATEMTGEFTIDYVPPAWYMQDASSAAGPVSEPPVPAVGPTTPPGQSQLDATSASPPQPPVTPPSDIDSREVGSTEPRSLVAELVEQTSPGRVVPLHVQIVQGSERGVQLRSFMLPPGGTQVIVTVHAPGLEAIDDLYQELHLWPGRDSDVLLFRLRASKPGLHEVTVRAFRGGTFLGEVTCQTSVGHGSVTRDGPQRHASLASMAFDPGEVTLQVLKEDGDGAFSFQLISETFYAREIVDFRAGDPRKATEAIYAELRKAAKAAATGGGASWLPDRLESQGVELWKSVVPQRIQSQFWEEADHVSAFTVLGEHDIVPWELLYPLNEGCDNRGFLAEWLPVVRRVHGQDRVRSLRLPGVAFVVPPGSPDNAGEEVRSLRARLGTAVSDAGVLTERAALTALIKGGHAGLLHFACHNAFTGTGSCVTMADGPFDPIDLASAAQLRTLRTHRPLVFFNACRSAGEIDWFGESLGWAPQFLTAGAGAFVGTLWPVRSRSALQFAETFYDQLLTHRQPLGKASLTARRTTHDLHGGDPTWLAYAVYGSPAATVHITA